MEPEGAGGEMKERSENVRQDEVRKGTIRTTGKAHRRNIRVRRRCTEIYYEVHCHLQLSVHVPPQSVSGTGR